MRTFVIGDIHGCLTALETLIESIAIDKSDLVITLGDYIDRGSDSKGVIDYLMDFKKDHRLIHLRGNHEELMELACETKMDRLMWSNVGGLATMLSYDVTNPSDIPAEHWEFFDACQLYYETDSHIFVHGGLQPDIPVEEQDDETLLWLRIDELQAHESGKTIICGHTPQHDHKVLNLGHAICVDTHAYASGWLTCLEVESGDYWQANEAGETRQLKLGKAQEL